MRISGTQATNMLAPMMGKRKAAQRVAKCRKAAESKGKSTIFGKGLPTINCDGGTFSTKDVRA